MTDEFNPRALRNAVAREDTATIADLLAGRPTADELLQLIGVGLLIAVTNGRAPDDVVQRWVAALRERAWPGDEELAGQLTGAAGTSDVAMLKPLHVDLEELAGILEGDPLEGGGAIELKTGEVWPRIILEDDKDLDPEDLDDPERWLYVHCEGSREGYHDMELFIDGLDDEFAVRILNRSIQGRGAFRRFRDELAEWPGLTERWSAFSSDRQIGRARVWLAEHGYASVPDWA